MPSAVAKPLSRLSRGTLAKLCVKWAKSSKNEPYLARNRDVIESQEEDYLHKVACDRDELVEVYDGILEDVDEVRDMTKRDIIDRIVDGDWRRGMTYQQIADIDFAHLEENDSSLRWSALKVIPLEAEAQADAEAVEQPNKRRKVQSTTTQKQQHYPGTDAALFVQNLKVHISPVVKAVYHIHVLQNLGIPIVRIQITPNKTFAPLSTNTPRPSAAFDSSRTLYIALPDSCPYVYVSMPGISNLPRNGSGKFVKTPQVDMTTLKRVLLEAIPKAMSKPQSRWSLKTTSVSAKSLRSVHLLCGGARVGATGGAFARFTAGDDEDDDYEYEVEDIDPAKERRRQVELRFGACGDSHAKLDRVQVTVQDLIGNKKGKKRKLDEDECRVGLTLSGTDVFAGLKQLALDYPDFVDLDRLPGALTGELDITSMVI